MNFKYKIPIRADFDPLKTPSIPITFIGNQTLDFLALLDSGADLSAIPKSVAKELGLSLEGEKSECAGIGGKVEAIETKIPIVIEKGHEKYNFKIPIKIILSDMDFTPLIGREGFFDKFKIIFDHNNERVILKRNNKI